MKVDLPLPTRSTISQAGLHGSTDACKPVVLVLLTLVHEDRPCNAGLLCTTAWRVTTGGAWQPSLSGTYTSVASQKKQKAV